MKPLVDHLGRFLGDYFHQDWDIGSEDDTAVVALFLSENPKKEVEKVYAGLCALIANTEATNSSISGYLLSVDCEYDCSTHAFTSIQWLKRLRAILEEVL